ncbi:MAG TPA: hypothetical protein DHN33_08295 [Eubacteriaceae bacterium]|nr:hypothetical protein [Eubacteriaceae bacterium]
MIYLIYGGIVVTGVGLIVLILQFLVRKKLNESNAVLWLIIGGVIIISGLFPGLVYRLSALFRITYPPAFVFTVAIIILLFIVLKNTIIISELYAKVHETAMEISILRLELDRKDKQLQEVRSKKRKEVEENDE